VKLLGTFALIVAICGCERPPQEYLADARGDLADTVYDDAIAAADAGLLADPDAATTWGLELVKLEAHARAGHAQEAKDQLERLASLHPNRVPASEYSATAYQLKSAGEKAAAIQVLDMGASVFPYDPVIGRMIEQSKTGSDPAELEMLRSLGYVE
jgi:tetratricopeptide (TPR) repeat protein